MSASHVILDTLADQARDLVTLRGPDSERFLQGTITADITALGDDAVPSALLTVKGKIVSDLVVWRDSEEAFSLLVPRAHAASVAELLDRHIIMDEVEVEHRAVTTALVWPAEQAPRDPVDGVLRKATRHPAPGVVVVGGADAVAQAVAGTDAVDAEAFDRHRIATASPAWGREIEPGFFPPEVGFVHAVSYDKGCYLGQEPLARIHARGQVNRVLVRVETADTLAGPVALSTADRPQAGTLRTFARDGDKTIGLAVLHRKAGDKGTVLQTDAEPPATVTVISEPLGADPGTPGKRTATVKLGGPR